MKKSHIAIIALSVSIAFLALFVGRSDIGVYQNGNGNGYETVSETAQ